VNAFRILIICAFSFFCVAEKIAAQFELPLAHHPDLLPLRNPAALHPGGEKRILLSGVHSLRMLERNATNLSTLGLNYYPVTEKDYQLERRRFFVSFSGLATHYLAGALQYLNVRGGGNLALTNRYRDSKKSEWLFDLSLGFQFSYEQWSLRPRRLRPWDWGDPIVTYLETVGRNSIIHLRSGIFGRLAHRRRLSRRSDTYRDFGGYFGLDFPFLTEIGSSDAIWRSQNGSFAIQRPGTTFRVFNLQAGFFHTYGEVTQRLHFYYDSRLIGGDLWGLQLLPQFALSKAINATQLCTGVGLDSERNYFFSVGIGNSFTRSPSFSRVMPSRVASPAPSYLAYYSSTSRAINREPSWGGRPLP